MDLTTFAAAISTSSPEDWQRSGVGPITTSTLMRGVGNEHLHEARDARDVSLRLAQVRSGGAVPPHVAVLRSDLRVGMKWGWQLTGQTHSTSSGTELSASGHADVIVQTAVELIFVGVVVAMRPAWYLATPEIPEAPVLLPTPDRVDGEPTPAAGLPQWHLDAVRLCHLLEFGPHRARDFDESFARMDVQVL